MKYPELGRVKTRLAKGVGENKALGLYQYLVNRTLQIASNGKWSVQLHWAQSMEAYPGFEKYPHVVQEGDTLGERMARSLEMALEEHDSAVLIGSDIPGIQQNILQKAFETLEQNDLVFGPAKDGGYYLVGAKSRHPELFDLKAWSHDKVLQDSLDIAQSSGLSYGLVDTLSDLDTIDDLQHYPELLNMAGMK